MKTGFTVDRKVHDETAPTADIAVELHRALDHLLDQLREGKAGGGMVLECGYEDGTSTQLRLTLCNWTDQTECPMCQGTGAENAVMVPTTVMVPTKSNGQIH